MRKIVSIGAVMMLWLLSSSPATATSDNLVWWPYLQQMTDTSVIILWTTQTGDTPVVEYGTSRTIPLGTQMHRVELTGLQPDTTYYYKVYTTGEDLLPEQTLTFRTAPPVGSDTPVTFIAFGDYGNDTPAQYRLRDQMVRDTSYDFILTTGDNTLTDGTYAEFDANVFRVYSEVFSRAPVFAVVGNHDYHTDFAGPYLDLFDLPQNAWRADHKERYYSFDYGSAHIVALDSDRPIYAIDRNADDDMFDWLRHDLANTTQLWIIVSMHVPAYSTGFHRRDAEVVSLPRLPHIFDAYGVDLVISGHDHTYQRTAPIRAGEITSTEAGGVVYLVTGAGSMASYSCEEAEWLVISYCSQVWGLYSRITVDNDQLFIEAVDAAGTILDAYTMTKTINVPLQGVSVTGPSQGAPDVGQTFVATANPVTVTVPLTYTWAVEAQPVLTQTSGLGSTATFTWTTPGLYTVTVTASGSQNAVTSLPYPVVITTTHP